MGGGASKQKLEELKKEKEKDRKDGISKRINFILNNKNLTKEQQIKLMILNVRFMMKTIVGVM